MFKLPGLGQVRVRFAYFVPTYPTGRFLPQIKGLWGLFIFAGHSNVALCGAFEGLQMQNAHGLAFANPAPALDQMARQLDDCILEWHEDPITRPGDNGSSPRETSEGRENKSLMPKDETLEF